MASTSDAAAVSSAAGTLALAAATTAVAFAVQPALVIQDDCTTDVSTEWHVHQVKQAAVAAGSEDGTLLASKCVMSVQCPNGRKHSSLFAVHLIPHWLLEVAPAAGRADTPVAVQNIKERSAPMTMLEFYDGQPSLGDHVRLSATLSDWLSGEVYPNAVLFNTHPNGHILADNQSPRLSTREGTVKTLLKIRRPADPVSPDDSMPLSRLSTLKLTLHVTFHREDSEWTRDFVSPGVLRLVSRVSEQKAGGAEGGRAKKRKGVKAPTEVVAELLDPTDARCLGPPADGAGAAHGGGGRSQLGAPPALLGSVGAPAASHTGALAKSSPSGVGVGGALDALGHGAAGEPAASAGRAQLQALFEQATAHDAAGTAAALRAVLAGEKQ